MIWWYWVVLGLLVILVFVGLRSEDKNSLQDRKKRNLPVHHLDSTEPITLSTQEQKTTHHLDGH